MVTYLVKGAIYSNVFIPLLFLREHAVKLNIKILDINLMKEIIQEIFLQLTFVNGGGVL